MLDGAVGRTVELAAGMNAGPLPQLDDAAEVAAGDPVSRDPRAFEPNGPLYVRMQNFGVIPFPFSAFRFQRPPEQGPVYAKRPTTLSSNSILIPKRAASGQVMFLHADNDGFRLDANHDQPVDEDDLPGLVEAFRDRGAHRVAWQERDTDAEWTENW